ncbi:cyclic Di-GMP phosphodiesterase RmdA [Pseudonocardia ailaonensis]|uniref:Cyclic Di-GMP phosphodiesterase RmdA n=1 Tax=Pseudonocardia ailaonensis TaxID=367279 RepID=A0ABN2N109_9PSEU
MARPGARTVAVAWRQAVAHTSLVWMTPRAMLAFLTGLAQDLLDVLCDPDPDHEVARAVGRRLVEAHFTEVEAIERSLAVLGDVLPEGRSPAALGSVLGALAAGYAQALQSRTLDEQQEITVAAFTARKEAEARFESVFEVAAIGMAVARVDGVILEVNRALGEMLGYRPDELEGRRFWEFVHPSDPDDHWDLVRDTVAGTGSDHLRMEKTYPHRDGSDILTDLVLSLIRDEEGRPRYVVAMVQDITERRRLQRSLEHQALHDPLTGLPNRRMFFDRLEAALAARTPGREPGVCYLDLDGFKAVNDTLGHDTGDQLISTVAARLSHVLTGHLVARMGGDEFVVLVERAASPERLEDVARAALAAVRRPVRLGEQEVSVTASVGVVRFDQASSGAAELMKAADTTMYWAKADGQDRVALFDAERHRRDVGRFAIMARMPEAFARGEFVVEYQPLVRLSDHRMIGVEALVRWQLPDGGRLGPAEFIPIAEQSGLIVPLGRSILERSCRQAAVWARARPDAALLMSVNLTARQLREPGVVDDVREILAESGLPAGSLQLELTESDVMGTTEDTLTPLHELAAMGVSIAIDDFGTGYSNLAYLRRLPVHTLKLAGPFVSGGPGTGVDEPVDAEIVGTLVQLAHTLGLSVTAESVETRRQQERLLDLGCDVGQGWYFSPSRPPAEILELLTRPTWPEP